MSIPVAEADLQLGRFADLETAILMRSSLMRPHRRSFASFSLNARGILLTLYSIEKRKQIFHHIEMDGETCEYVTVESAALRTAGIVINPTLTKWVAPSGEDSYDFHELLGSTAGSDLSFPWAGFKLLASFLKTGKYANDEFSATHYNVYLVAERMDAKNICDKVMRALLNKLRTEHLDPKTLAPILRHLFEFAKADSLLIKLYLDIAAWEYPHKLYLKCGGTRNPHHLNATGFSLETDGNLLEALQHHVRETVHWAPPHCNPNNLHLESHRKKAPWLDYPSRYYLLDEDSD